MTIIGLESQEQEKNVVEEYNRTAYKWKWVITTNSDSGGIKTLLRVSKPTKITNLGITQEDDQAGTGFN